MKKLSFLALAAAGLLMVGCADKDVAADENPNLLNGKTEGFFKINLNLPSAPAVSTRGWEESASGTLSDGLPIEYGVKSLILLLFDGSSESEATLTQVINLGAASMDDVTVDNPNQVTKKKEYVAKLNNAPTANLYALAVVNGKGIITMKDESTIVLCGEEKTGITISALQAATASSSSVSSNAFIYKEDGTDYYFMTNAVLSNEKGGTQQPSTAAGDLHILAKVDKSFIYETQKKAEDGTAATDIYVERGMSKVTIKESPTLGTDALTAKTGITLSASLDGWCLDITNKSSYVVRQVPSGNIWDLTSYGTASVDKYRFIGGNSVDVEYGTAKAGYRTYWAKDPNYNGDLTFTDGKNTTNFSYADYSNDATGDIGDNHPLYCFENTFDVAHQDARYTTRAIIGVKLTSTGTFYIIGADRKTLYTLADVEAQVLTTLKGISAFSDWYGTAGNGHTLSSSDVTIDWDKATAGKIEVASVTIAGSAIGAGSSANSNLTINSSTTTVDSKDLSSVISTLNAQLTNVERFVDGVAYYAIRIKHFGDDLTPWNNGEFYTGHQPAEAGAKGTSETDAEYEARQIASIYPDAGASASEHRQEANYLGRYGMVRNNWYELEIGDILKIGSSEPPVIPSHPDDDLEDLYIKARINILSWAKRPQSWDLK